MRTIVVLPEPLGPSSPRTVPASATRSTPARAVVAPKRLTTPWACNCRIVVVRVWRRMACRTRFGLWCRFVTCSSGLSMGEWRGRVEVSPGCVRSGEAHAWPVGLRRGIRVVWVGQPAGADRQPRLSPSLLSRSRSRGSSGRSGTFLLVLPSPARRLGPEPTRREGR